MPDYLPSTDADLLAWSGNFDTRITAAPTAVGLTALQATAYNVLHTAFADAMAAISGGNNSTPAVVTKNDARAALIRNSGGIRDLVNIVQAFPGTTNTQRAELQITIPDVEPTPAPIPSAAPEVSVTSVNGWTVRMRLRDTQNPDNKGKPPFVAAAHIYSFVGETAPTDIKQWNFEGAVSRTIVTVQMPNTLAVGTKLWFTAVWVNTRMESGPQATPASTQVNYGGLAQAA